MTIVGIAHVSGITTISREDTHPIARPVEQHPAWCVSVDSLGPCGDHLGEGTNIPATAGGFHVVYEGALFPRFEVAATTQDGALGVNVSLFDPSATDFEWVEVCLRPAVAREFAAALEAGHTAQAAGINQSSAWITSTGGEPVTVTVINRDLKTLLSARLYAHEVKTLAGAILQAADVVEGRTPAEQAA